MEINNSLPIIDYSDNETGCCPKFHPENWDEKIFNFDELKFIKASTKKLYAYAYKHGQCYDKNLLELFKVQKQKQPSNILYFQRTFQVGNPTIIF